MKTIISIATAIVMATTSPQPAPIRPYSQTFFGTVRTDSYHWMEDGGPELSDWMHKQSTYTGTRYPAVMLTTGLNDPRVAPWEVAKMTARLQAATNSGKPVLLRADEQAGHGLAESVSSTVNEFTDVYTFMLWQLGEPAFQM